MGYEAEEIRQSQEIFYYLLEHRELQEEQEQLLYRAYAEQESVQNLVKSQGEVALCNIERYGNVIYLIPKEENHFLGCPVSWSSLSFHPVLHIQSIPASAKTSIYYAEILLL